MTYSFCESVYASATSSWHMRELTDKGRKLGGGIDTKSLCGLVERGWDLDVPLTKHHLKNNTCKNCLKEYQRGLK